MGPVLHVLLESLFEYARERVGVDDHDNEPAEPIELTAQDYEVLGGVALHYRRSVTVETLAEYVERNRRSVSGSVYRLHQEGYVEFTDGLRVRARRNW